MRALGKGETKERSALAAVRPIRAWGLCAALPLSIVVLHPALARADDAAPDPRAGMATIEGLLQELELPYRVDKNGEYKVAYVDTAGKATTIYVRYTSVGDLPEDQLIHLYIEVMPYPDKLPDPLRFYQEMASFNDDIVVGRISVNDGYVFYSSSFWLRKADATTLDVEMVVAHGTNADAYQVLQPIASGTME